MSDDFWGVNLRDFVIGMQGSISGVFALRNFKPVNIISSVVVGGFTANYLNMMISALWPFGTIAHDTAVYVAGLAGIGLSMGILKIIDTWTQRMVK